MAVRLLTYNLWHGLDGQGLLFFGELEPRKRKLARAQVQIECLRRWSADLLFLQEVNPLFPAAYYYSSQLGKDHISQMDLSGIKLLGFGPPFNLQSGQVILAPKKWRLRSLGGEQLSGDRPANQGLFSFQLRESRYALFGEMEHPSWGRVLLANVHLHHGLEYDNSWNLILNRAVQEGELLESERRILQRQLLKGDVRREKEVNRLLLKIESLSSKYDLVLVAGDFNSSPASPVVRMMHSAGFQDSWLASGQALPGLTWSHQGNEENHAFNDGFQGGFTWDEDAGPESIRGRLLSLAHEAERRPRRIDYLFYRTSHKVLLKTELFTGQSEESDLFGSDHFGLGVIMQKAAN
ncbi:MAG: endonuclease/exonuclease/phosphatase family protein [Bdellovibrionaceae bacterium]|nr:endonuclease/exonuclease/phosphatase family protein [Bdellovibrionales bacterium]MCB9083127.1 endonuclease/exonuclease/phosphatase family protein [Pseudobdellovibrionaceae bacterium]